MLGKSNHLPIARFEVGFIDDPYLGISLNLYCCGCWHRCPGCQNPELQDPDSPLCKKLTVEEVIEEIKKNVELIDSVVFLGGDFGYYPQQLRQISEIVKKRFNKRCVLYTGFTLEQLRPEVLDFIDIVVDGEYKQELHRDGFPASSNQRLWVKEGKKWKQVDSDTTPLSKLLRSRLGVGDD